MTDASAPIDQVPFGGDDFASNPEPRCPVVLLLDTSGSMTGAPIQQLNQGLQLFRDELAADSLAAKRVEVAVVTFGPVEVAAEFQTADSFIPPHLTAKSDTPMGAAVQQAISMVESRKSDYKLHGIAYYRPWIFLITDGGPTDSWEEAAEASRRGQESKQFAFFAVGVQGARMDVLSRFCAPREPLKLDGLRFRDLFQWLSTSMKSVSHSRTDEVIPLVNPTSGPTGWAVV